ncbi:MAG: sulfate permease [Bacteroidota bacterium]
MNLKSFFPILTWLPTYTLNQLKGDLVAGVTVGVMAIPQGMAYAMIVGLPPIYGLYATTLPLFIYAILGTSRQLSVGPMATISILTAAGVSTLATQGTEEFIGMTLLLAFIVGAIQLVLGLFRLGFLVNFLSRPVISGFTSASAFIIGFSQLNHLLGIKIPQSQFFYLTLWETSKQVGNINFLSIAVGLGGIALILLLKRIHKSIPGSLLVVILGILLVWLSGWNEKNLSIIGTIPEGLPGIHIPTFNLNSIKSLLPIAFAISLVSYMQSIAISKTIQSIRKNYKILPNQELIAQGMANLIGSFGGAFPVTGSLSRTAVNNQVGANTGMASIISGIIIVSTLLFLTPLFYYLPKAVLASIVMVSVLGLIDRKTALYLWKTDRSDFFMLLATFLSTLFLGIELGIVIGVALSISIIIFRTTKPHVAELGQVPNTPFFRNVKRFEQVVERPDLLIVRFDAQLYFANINFVRETMEELIEKKGKLLKGIIVNAEAINDVDSSAIMVIKDLILEWKAKSFAIYFTDIKGPVRDVIHKAGGVELIGKENFFMSIPEAIQYHDLHDKENWDNSLQTYTLQSN